MTGNASTRLSGRAKDERDLRWLRLRRAGRSAAEIAADEGVSIYSVRNAVNEIRRADIAHAPEDGAKDGYWKRNKKGAKK